jgi:hypothetical protein
MDPSRKKGRKPLERSGQPRLTKPVPGLFQVSFGAGWKQAGAGWCAYALCRLNFGADGLAVEPLTLSSEKVSGQY